MEDHAVDVEKQAVASSRGYRQQYDDCLGIAMTGPSHEIGQRAGDGGLVRIGKEGDCSSIT